MVDLTGDDLRMFRFRARVTPEEMGRAMGLSRSSYYALETDTAVLCDRHVLLFEALAYRVAAQREDLFFLLPHQIPTFRALVRLAIQARSA